jgi:hypothetical protein
MPAAQLTVNNQRKSMGFKRIAAVPLAACQLVTETAHMLSRMKHVVQHQALCYS